MLRLNQILRLWFTDNDNEKFYSRDMPDIDREIDGQNFKIENISLLAGAVDYQVSFGKITTATFIYISTDTPITFKLNSTSNLAITATDLNPTVLNTDGVTALYLSNNLPNAIDAVIEIMVCKQVIPD